MERLEKAKGVQIDPVKIASFKCRVHPSEQIVRVCMDSSCDFPFLCVECIIFHEQAHKHSIVKIPEFVSKIVNDGNPMATYASSSKLPSKFQNYLKSEAENMVLVSTHIEKEKAGLKHFFDQLSAELLKSMSTCKDKNVAFLDNQCSKYLTNCRFFRDKITTFYKCEESDRANQLESISTLEDLELFMVTKKLDQELVDQCKESENFEIEMMTTLTAYHENLVKQTKSLPKVETTQGALAKTSEEIRECLEKIFDEGLLVKNEINYIYGPGRFDSKIISSEQSKLLLEWLKDTKLKIKPKLLYRASRDGFEATIFHSKCDGKGPTIVIIHSNFKKKFGAFANKDWSQGSGSYVSDDKCFLFSFDEKKKIPLNSSHHQYAMCPNTSTGPAFGGGHGNPLFTLPLICFNAFS